MSETCVELDGSRGEGGGQILRSALTLSILTGRPFKLVNIRANRDRPGLRPQHLMCVRAAAAISGATCRGATLDSSCLYFEPSVVKPGSYTFAIGTAGATALVLQTVVLPLALRSRETSTVVVTGGTHAENAPCYHFLETTWAGYLRRLGLTVELEMRRPGFYPRGGGEVRAVIRPAERVHGLNLTSCPELTRASGFSAFAGLPESVGRRQADRLAKRLRAAGIEADIELVEWRTASPGSVAAVIFPQTPVRTLFCALGRRGKPAEAVADDVAEEALRFRERGGPVDPCSADQILLPLVFSPEESRYRTSEVTRHLTTNIDTVRKFLGREITLDGTEGGPGTVRVAAVV
jgi:RNA 3'-phosphate cyclase